jgi:hypothetical protein
MNVSPDVKRPFRVNILALLVFGVSAWNGLRMGEAIFFWKTIEQYGASPLYISMSGGAWLIIGLSIFWGLWMGKIWGWMATILGTACYTSWYWFNRMVLQESHANWPFVLITHIILLLVISCILFSHRTRRFFTRDVYERKPETPTAT